MRLTLIAQLGAGIAGGVQGAEGSGIGEEGARPSAASSEPGALRETRENHSAAEPVKSARIFITGSPDTVDHTDGMFFYEDVFRKGAR